VFIEVAGDSVFLLKIVVFYIIAFVERSLRLKRFIAVALIVVNMTNKPT
jgi:hypothetical protein